MLRRQELLDRIRHEQSEDRRPKTYSPRRRYTPSPLPPPSRRSLPDVNTKTYFFEPPGNRNTEEDMSQVKHVIEHQFRPAPPAQQTYLPPIQPQAMVQTPAEAIPVQPIQPVAAVQPAYVNLGGYRDKAFNKGDFMDMMMMQNAQMNQMVMSQMMLNQIPAMRPGTYPMAAEPAMTAMPMMRAAPSVYHHHIQTQPYGVPPMDYRGGGGNYRPSARSYNNSSFINDDGSNYYAYH